jgi:uncharacterized repeat protein (TIGR01451 family)
MPAVGATGIITSIRGQTFDLRSKNRRSDPGHPVLRRRYAHTPLGRVVPRQCGEAQINGVRASYRKSEGVTLNHEPRALEENKGLTPECLTGGKRRSDPRMPDRRMPRTTASLGCGADPRPRSLAQCLLDTAASAIRGRRRCHADRHRTRRNDVRLNPTPANNTSTAIVAAAPATADLVITKNAGSANVAAAGAVTYTIGVTNNGDATATAVTDILPAGTTFVSATPTREPAAVRRPSPATPARSPPARQ